MCRCYPDKDMELWIFWLEGKTDEWDEKKTCLLLVEKGKEWSDIRLQANHGIQSHHFMANRWGNSGWLIVLGFKITADGDCRHEIKRHLLLGWKVMTNLNSRLKSRDITLPTKVHLVKAMVFPVVMYGCEGWTQESWAWKNWCFWTVVLERTLESA